MSAILELGLLLPLLLESRCFRLSLSTWSEVEEEEEARECRRDEAGDEMVELGSGSSSSSSRDEPVESFFEEDKEGPALLNDSSVRIGRRRRVFFYWWLVGRWMDGFGGGAVLELREKKVTWGLSGLVWGWISFFSRLLKCGLMNG